MKNILMIDLETTGTKPGCKEAEGNVLKHTALEDAKAQMRGLRHFHQHYIEKV